MLHHQPPILILFKKPPPPSPSPPTASNTMPPPPGPPGAAAAGSAVVAGSPLPPPVFVPKTTVVAGTYDGGIVGWEVQRGTKDATGPAKPAALKMVCMPSPLALERMKFVGSIVCGANMLCVLWLKSNLSPPHENPLLILPISDPSPSSSSPLQTFAYTPHQGSVRSLAIPREGAKAGLLLVSGGMDEHIRMYDLRKRAEVGELLHHKGTITALGFVGSSHLLSGSEDGLVCIWRVYDWSLLHILGGHKGAVTAVALHPSGKLALSTGRDRSLRLWDLVKGRCAYITKLEAVAESVKWSEGGETYALLLGDRRLEVRRTADNKPTAILTHPLRITSLAFLPSSSSDSDDEEEEGEEGKGGGKKVQHVLTACDDGQLRVVDGASGDIISTTDVTPFCGRIKEAVLLHSNSSSSSSEDGGRELVTASSNGKVIIWSINAAGTVLQPGPSTNLGEGVRITCLAAYAASEGGEGAAAAAAAAGLKKKKKRKRRQAEEEGEEGGEAAVVDRGMLRHEKKKMKKLQKKKDRASQGSSGGSPHKQQAQSGGAAGTRKDGGSGKKGEKPHQQEASSNKKKFEKKQHQQKTEKPLVVKSTGGVVNF